MGLISKEAVLKHLNDVWLNNTPSISDSKEMHAVQAAKADGIAIAMSVVEGFKTVDAVPLDKLCEWLERYAAMDCDGCREAFGSCEDEENQEVIVCNSQERWKAMLTKWMEEQDAKEET